MPDLDLEPAPLSGAPGLRVSGELDLGTAPALETALDAAIRAGAGAFVVDLSDVTFLDSSAVSVLMRARALLGREERELVVVCPPGPVRRVFDVAGIADLFDLFASRRDAAGALVPADGAVADP